MSTISFGGLASGLDTESIITSLLSIKQQPVTRLQNRISGYEYKKAAYTEIQTRMATLLSAIEGLDSSEDFASLATTSGNEDLMTATAGSLATPASYGVTINNLAAAQKDRTQGYDTVNDSVGVGTFSLTIDGTTTDITMPAGASSIGDLKFAINEANLGVTATILYDGSESGGYYMVVSSENEGTDAAFTMDTSGLSGGTSPAFTNVTMAQNAEMIIDGITVTSQSNTVTGVIEGVTLDLLAADTASPTTLDVAVDPEQIRGKVQTFVDAYNDLFTYIDEQTAEEAILQGDGTVRMVVSRIQNIITSRLGSGDITTLGQVGIDQVEDGLLSFTTEDFDEMLADDYQGVRDLFAGSDESGGMVYLLGLSLSDMTDSVDGVFEATNEGLDDRISDAESSIERYESSMESYEARLRAQFTAMEELISSLQSQGQALSSFNVS